MYKLVQTKEDERIFQDVYREICRTEQFEVEQSSTGAIQYLFYQDDKPVGTIEFAPYQPHDFTTVADFDFTQIDVIRENLGEVWEIDKVGFLKNHRKTGLLEELFEILAMMYQQHQADYVVCLYEYRFYRLMKRMSPKHIQAVGESFLVKGERSKVVPAIIDTHGWVKQYQEEKRMKIKNNQV